MLFDNSLVDIRRLAPRHRQKIVDVDKLVAFVNEKKLEI